MKIDSTFQVLVFFISVLIFSMPVITLAQQDLELVGPITAFEQFVQQNPELVEAITAAEQDAKANVNQLVWGCSNSLLSGGLGLGIIIGTVSIMPNDSSGDSIAPFLIFGCIGGSIASILPGILAARNYQPSPPAARLVGKSPEYVETYTEAYKAKVKNLQLSAAVPGGIVGCLSIPMMFAFLRDPSGF